MRIVGIILSRVCAASSETAIYFDQSKSFYSHVLQRTALELAHSTILWLFGLFQIQLNLHVIHIMLCYVVFYIVCNVM